MSNAGAWASEYHAPVMAARIVELFRGCDDVLDGTLGGGGHALALLEAGARVTGIDRDPEAVAAARERLAAFETAGRFRAITANYADLDDVAALAQARFNGVLLDLGVSSHQLDDFARGFTFREGAALDMRMEGSVHDDGSDAASLLQEADERTLTHIFRDYADEPRAQRLAREIVRRRERRPFATSDDLVDAIRAALGAPPRTGPAVFARLFQAVRIAVNDELGGLERALPSLRDRLTPGGVMAVIAYHSGEDRIVKQTFRAWSAACTCPPRQPICTCGGRALGTTLTRKAIAASNAEVEANPRARSAHLRAWQSAA
ncbi:MAG TPA: 16S rRNA (cytosine(1402)-N(4))-methyltransferase RsmH [Gemmatimonadaceae bacterium]|nr:16S rRNA (cytosine(1402)-N(4))-methyltransferase RsmH [Gemmatimonadaceae bacterium]